MKIKLAVRRLSAAQRQGIRPALAGAAFAAGLLLSTSVWGFAITDVTITTVGNQVNVTSTTGQNHHQFMSSTSAAPADQSTADVAGAMLSFDVRYAAAAVADREATASSFDQSYSSAYQVTFSISDPTNAGYTLEIATSRLGSMVIFDDSGGSATANIGAVTGMLDGIVQSDLGYVALGPFTSSTTASSAIDQTGNLLSLDFTGDRTFVLAFSWTMGQLTSAQDEVAILLGLNCTLAGTSLCGTGDQSGNGHFLDVKATLLGNGTDPNGPARIPEPGTLVLLALGLIGAALFRRRRID